MLKPSQIINVELPVYTAFQEGKITIMGDVAKWVTCAAKRLQILAILVEKHNDTWTEEEYNQFLSFYPDLEEV